MNTENNEQQYLQNAADNLNMGIIVHEYYMSDKRKKIKKYFLVKDNALFSPILPYSELNHFIFGMIKYKNTMQKSNLKTA